MEWHPLRRRKYLKTQEERVELVLHEKEQEKRKLDKISRKTGRIVESLSRDREKNHYSDRIRLLFGSDRRRARE